MEIFKFTIPSEECRYRLFDEKFEDDSLVFFHTTPVTNIESITKNGFLPKGNLDSVSYANNSSSCLAHRGHSVQDDHAVFVVEFDSLEGIKVNTSDIHVYKKIQPKIIGYCVVPKEYDFR